MKIPNKMKYIEIKKFGPAEGLKLSETEIPNISKNEVLIQVYASGINRPDILQRLGQYPPPKGASTIPGLEVAGKIVKIGNNVKQFKLGDKVCALTHGGGYAQYCKVYWKHVLPIPKYFNYIQAAAIPENFFTVWFNLIDIGNLKKSDIVLIHGGSSGIGTSAIQIAKHLGCKVIVTVGNAKKAKACRELGADLVINYKNKDFSIEIEKFTDFNGVDVILDMIGKEYFEKNISLLRDKGRLIVIAFLTGNISRIDLKNILINRLIITGSTLRPRSNEEKARIVKQVFKSYWTELSKKTIKPIIFKTFSLQDAWKAHKLMESSKHIGKIILTQKH
jgi:NADPH2:quinone reductase